MFYKVVWQHMQEVVGFLVIPFYCKFTKKYVTKKLVNRLNVCHNLENLSKIGPIQFEIIVL